ncbi:MAG: hypothetical protein IAG10_34225, partial [Planctomycetaceae bacterium]|nr:hypothetical protein [Planctomycetaceae bacterium]
MAETSSSIAGSPTFLLLGPRWEGTKAVWTAQATVLAEKNAASGAITRQARLVHEPLEPRTVHQNHITRFPGSMWMRLRITQVTLRLGEVECSLDAPSDVVEASFLVNSNPDGWTGDGAYDINRMLCLAGQFPLTPFLRGGNLPDPIRNQLEGVFPLQRPADATSSAPMVPNKIEELVASSSGLLFDGRPRMPDQMQSQVNLLPFILEVAADAPKSNPPTAAPKDGTFVMRIDRERLPLPRYEAGQQELKSYFTKLDRRINPTQTVGGIDIPMLHWMRLELTDPRRLPEFHWRVKPSVPTDPELNFAEG